MSASTNQASFASAEPTQLDALLSAISDAIEALVAWDITAFQSAVERQSTICDRLAAIQSSWSQDPAAETARRIAAHKVQKLNRVYDRLLQHSVHWTHIIRSILQASGHSLPNHASVHFRA